MKLVKPSFEIIEQKPGHTGLLQHIERCGRTCYKSEDKISANSATKFVDMLVNRGHTAMVEHGTVYLHVEDYFNSDTSKVIAHYSGTGSSISSSTFDVEKVKSNPHSECKIMGLGMHGRQAFITTNCRVLLQNGWLDDLKYQCEPTEHHVKRVTVKFVCDRGVSHEFVRHRVFSFAQESTRYCNYSKDKFGKECTFIMPSWIPYVPGTWGTSETEDSWGNYNGTIITFDGKSIENNIPKEDRDYLRTYIMSLEASERAYFNLLDKGWIAQQARAVLPNSLKTELIMTGTIEQWEGFFKLRDDKQHAHPQAYELAHPLHEEFIRRGLING